MVRLLVTGVMLGVLAGGCVDTSDGWKEGGADGGTTSPDAGGPCKENASRCVGQSYQVCVGGQYRQKWLCAADKVCSSSLGCVDCDPSAGNGGYGCKDNSVYSCSKNGQLGTKVKDCLGLTCSAGACRAPTCAFGSRLIYVVDANYRLLSFDPAKESNHFKLIAKLQCPASAPWSFRPAPATPFSMSVDRSARAWILYTSGEIFWVSTKTGACKKAPFSRGQQDFKLFGMGFVADAKGSNGEKLYVSNSKENSSVAPDKLGHVDPSTMQLSVLGQMTRAEYSAELTGTGNAELYAYNPGSMSSSISQVDKKTGKALKTWKVTAPGGTVSAWAFAHWGGKFYIFVTTQSFLGAEKSMVQRLNPANGKTTTFLANIPYRIVGAGVSTCAPVID